MANESKQRRVDKRHALLSTAEQLFTRFGAKKVTIEEICLMACVSKMTFYKHFKDKTDLVRCIHDELVERGFAAFDEISAKQIPFFEKIEEMGRWKHAFMNRLSVGFFEELMDIGHSVEGYKTRYLKNIIEAQKQGEVRGDIDPEFLWLVLEKLGEIFKGDEWRRICPDLGEVQRQLRAIIWNGLLEKVPTDASRCSRHKGDPL